MTAVDFPTIQVTNNETRAVRTITTEQYHGFLLEQLERYQARTDPNYTGDLTPMTDEELEQLNDLAGWRAIMADMA